jgi:RHH-type proline utilization regulon transcriptional repressor/proline dehydrogenase/delta 1-pyrroline-5-carboxylate dehydrogenase
MRQGSEAVVFLGSSKTSMTPPDQDKIESRTLEIGQQIFEASKLNLFARNYWYSKMMELATSDQRVKTQLFRFVDVLPVLKTTRQKRDHLIEYLSKAPKAERWPLSLRVISQLVSMPGLDKLLVGIADFQVRQMANNFIIGQDLETALPR